MTSPHGYTCACCGEAHHEPAFAWHVPAPDVWRSRYAKREDSSLDDELCVIKGTHFFIRGIIEIPVLDAAQPFHWGVWSSLSEANFARTVDLWEQPGRESVEPMFGWLSTAVAGYRPSTLRLKVNVHTQPVGRRPLLELEPTDHPLAVQQREGITTARAREIVEWLSRRP
jgi:hypothetical protein